MFLRPSNIEDRPSILNLDIQKIASMARENPQNWECLLMKRNYRDFAWDHIGGHNELGEFPDQTMRREVQEEVGWNIERQLEICRQWKDGFLKGFLYLSIPSEKTYLEDNPNRTPCHEVQTIAYFNLLHLLNSGDFKSNVKGRIKAFIEGKSDFNLQ